jgi:hypothetical protein
MKGPGDCLKGFEHKLINQKRQGLFKSIIQIIESSHNYEGI